MSRAAFLLYNLALLPFYPALGLYLLYRRFVQKKSAASVSGLLGHVPAEARRALAAKSGPRIWLHAVSVGETIAAKPVLQALRAALPDCSIALSNTTDGGHATAQGLLKSGEVDALFFFPLDVPFAVNRTLRAIRPDIVLFMETEIWPNTLHCARRRGAKTLLVNGRVSDNLLTMAPRMGMLWTWMTGNLSGFLMRDASDAERLRQLKVPADAIRVTGDVKLEAPPVSIAELRSKWRANFGLRDELLWVAGSTHPGEEAMILKAYRELLAEFPSLCLVLAPRHPDRLPEVQTAAEEAGFPFELRTQSGHCRPGVPLILDTVGELADSYAAADIAFVGGSLIKRGGHNLLEPVLRGAPVVFGPFVMNFVTSANLVTEASIGQKIADEDALVPAVSHWLRDNAARSELPKRVEDHLGRHRGAAARVAEQVTIVLREGSPK